MKLAWLCRALSWRQLELLRTPLHLSLYLQGNPQQQPTFRGLQDLLDRYWKEKRARVNRQLGRSAKWLEVVETLADWLSDHQTLSAPADVLDEFEDDARAMASEFVLVFDGKHWRFFHETFFDYCFARAFVRRNGQLLDLLLKSEQHLFRRGQVRQILAFQRGRGDTTAYLAVLEQLLSEGRVRFHLKRLAIDWLRTLDDPSEQEWTLLHRFLLIQNWINISKFCRTGMCHGSTSC